jgi:hypothetical protein
MHLAPPRRARRAALLAGLAFLCAPPALAADEATDGSPGITEEQVMAIAFDVLVMRPMGFTQVVIGGAVLPIACGVAMVSWMFDLPGALEFQEIVDYMVKAPAENTFERPLGELS